MTRKPGRLLALSAVALVSVIVVVTHRFTPDRWSGMASDILHSLHGPGFALLGIAVLWYLQRRYRSGSNYVLAAAIVFAIGVVAEVSQIPGPHDAQLSDLLVNGLGIVGAIGTAALFDRKLRQRLSRIGRASILLVCIPALLYSCIPTLWYSYVTVQQLRAVPELLTFEHYWELQTFGQPNAQRPQLIPAPAGWPVDGTTIARAQEQGRWGIFLSQHVPRNWSDYSTLSFVAASTDGPLALVVGIRDIHPGRDAPRNRFYKRVNVTATPQRFSISFDEIRAKSSERPFDFSHVASVVFSTAKPSDGAELLIDDIRLE
jgi:hypothetical protein